MPTQANRFEWEHESTFKSWYLYDKARDLDIADIHKDSVNINLYACFFRSNSYDGLIIESYNDIEQAKADILREAELTW